MKTIITGTKRTEISKDTNNGTYTARIFQDINTDFENLWITKTLKTETGVTNWADKQVA
jgi:hypothetical protein